MPIYNNPKNDLGYVELIEIDAIIPLKLPEV